MTAHPSVFRRRRPVSLPLLVAGAWVALTASGCSNPVADGGDDHPDPAGLIVRLGSSELVQISGGTTTGSLQLSPRQSLGPLTVVFVDEYGNPIEADSDESLEVVSSSTTIVRFEHSVPGSFTGTLIAGTEGSATLRFQLMHGTGSTAHADYISPPVSVTVVPVVPS